MAWVGRLAALPEPRMRHCVAMVLAMIVAVAAVPVLTPDLRTVAGSPQLATTVPSGFGDWTLVDMPRPPIDVVANDGRGTLQQPYDEVLMRTYRNSAGQTVTLALAYGREQRQDIKVHRPELCYSAAGFRVVSMKDTDFTPLHGAQAVVRGKRLYAEGRHGNEAVSYWIRIGSVYTVNGWDVRRHIVAQGLRGTIPDGMLVRVSRPVENLADAEAVWPQLEAFLQDMVAALPDQTRSFLVQ